MLCVQILKIEKLEVCARSRLTPVTMMGQSVWRTPVHALPVSSQTGSTLAVRKLYLHWHYTLAVNLDYISIGIIRLL